MNLEKFVLGFLNKKNVISFLVSCVFVVICFAIVVLRIFNPYHRTIAVVLYLVSWVFYIYPVIRKMNMKRLQNNPQVQILKRYYVSILTAVVFLLCLYALVVLFPIDQIMLGAQEIDILEEKTAKDSEYLQTIIVSLDKSYLALLDSGSLQLTMEDSNPELNSVLKEEFAIVVDHIVLLEQFTEEYKYFYQIDYGKHPILNMKAFVIAYAAYMAKYKTVHELTKEVGDNQYVEILLNEELSELGERNVYHKLKNRLNHPNTILRVNTGRAYLELIKSQDEKLPEGILDLMEYSDSAYDTVVGSFDHSAAVGIDSVLDTFEKKTMKEWLPIQKTVANILGDTKITARHDYFVSDEQIQELYNVLEPGDIMFQRRNWYVSNAGMPGFWTHAALYVGDLDELDKYFEKEAEELFNSSVSDHLKDKYPNVYNDKSRTFDGNYLNTIEGKESGVVMLAMEVSGKADYLAFIRPRLSKQDKLLALMYGFSIYQRPYDFNFDFSTDDSLVCSEVVYKAYLPTSSKEGLSYELGTIAGRPMLTPHDMVRTFDENFGTEHQQNDFVYFLDGNEKEQRAIPKDADEFRESWKRPKYAVFLD